MLDFEAITGAVTPEDPSGPDLDSDGDAQYLNFFAGTEPLLPMSYFEVVGVERRTRALRPEIGRFRCAVLRGDAACWRARGICA